MSRPLLVLAVAQCLVTAAAGARPGFTPQPPDTEGREPSELLVTVPASVLLPSLVTGTADRAARALHVSSGRVRGGRGFGAQCGRDAGRVSAEALALVLSSGLLVVESVRAVAAIM